MSNALKIARNLIRVGRVNSVNPTKGTVDVLFEDKDNMISSDLPLLAFEFNIPKVGTQVLCVFLGNGLESGICLGSFYSDINPPPASTNSIMYRKQLDTDTYIEYDKNDKKLKVIVDKVEINIHSGKVAIEAEEITLGTNATEGIPLGEQLKNWLDNHTHPISWTDAGGNGVSGTPTSNSPKPSQRIKIE